jgi:methyl-accepting chemotaxis protein
VRIKGKLLSGYVLVSFLIVVAASVAVYGFNDMKGRYQSIIKTDQPIIINLREIQYYFTGQANDERGFLLTEGTEFKKEIEAKNEQVKKRINIVKKLIDTEQENIKAIL